MAKEYPSTLLEFEHWFRTDEACRDYLIKLRWPRGFQCPACGNNKTWSRTRGLLRCGQCRRDVSVTAGTIFHGSHIPLRAWFRAAWWVTNQKSGVNALGLQRLLGFGSYKTAWSCLHRLRRAMVRFGRERLSGQIEVDETFVGGLRKGDTSKRKKMAVVIAAEVRGKGIGRVRMARVATISTQDIEAFVKASVDPGSRIITDGWRAYGGLKQAGYQHAPTVQDGHGREASVAILPRVHRIASLLKRWLLGTYQGRVSAPKIDRYLDEFSFRFNRRKSPARGMLFYRLIQQSVAVNPDPIE